ncbi:hypothetical protein [Actinokineospora terrae]|uniref:Secreted protein n=1 Tax=Actinokineospora terrae TaxID=155974 RepID=A0A1H9X2S6_9PSEU|nr:hypothetical protein [Actinokineospora terrae]SES40331.1 hypothetical protein SAMN04487818_112190 [Actinokineospora terrae]
MGRRRVGVVLAVAAFGAVLFPGAAQATTTGFFFKAGPFSTNSECMYQRDITMGQPNTVVTPSSGDCNRDYLGWYYESFEIF